MDKKKIWKEIWSWILSVALPMGIVLLINLFVCKLAVVSGNSMYPTLYDRDLLLVWMLKEQPETGDIVVVKSDDESYMHGEMLVKRVIATGGQNVVLDYDENAVYVDGVRLEEPYINLEEADPMIATGSATEVTVPEGCIYVLGDNRNHSGDSRSSEIGCIAPENIVGVQIVRIPMGVWRARG